MPGLASGFFLYSTAMTACFPRCFATVLLMLAIGPLGAAEKLAAPALARARPSADVLFVAHWVAQSADNMGAAFAIVDKKQARVFVFEAGGAFRGAAPVLLGLARGDDSVPGIGERPIASILPQERTTPAGRFVSEPGANTHGEDIVWVDYDAAVSMHRARVVDPKERRFERLATPTPDDNRISYGCINVPIAFYDSTVRPLLGKAKGVIYVLPETRPVRSMFGPQAGAAFAAARQ
jgi:hypothetical protein